MEKEDSRPHSQTAFTTRRKTDPGSDQSDIQRNLADDIAAISKGDDDEEEKIFKRGRSNTVPAQRRLTRIQSMTNVLATATKKLVKWKSVKTMNTNYVGSPDPVRRDLAGESPVDASDLDSTKYFDKLHIGSGADLCKAIHLKDIQMVKHIVKDHPEIYAARAFSADWARRKKRTISNSPDDKGRTPLFKAMEYKLNDIVKLLLENEADIALKMRDGTGRTVFHECARGGYMTGLKLIFESKETHSPDTDLELLIPRFELQNSGRQGYDGGEGVKIAGAEVEEKVTRGKEEPEASPPKHTRFLDELTVDSSVKALANTRDSSNALPLHRAAQFDHMVVAETLIRWGSELDAQDEAGNTPLMIASRWAAQRTLKVLLDAGADMRLRNAHEKSALELAVVPDVIYLLRSYEHKLSSPVPQVPDV